MSPKGENLQKSSFADVKVFAKLMAVSRKVYILYIAEEKRAALFFGTFSSFGSLSLSRSNLPFQQTLISQLVHSLNGQISNSKGRAQQTAEERERLRRKVCTTKL